ncbi:MAG: 16S rRNA (cytosine(967)-C(5))-methyltransferase RsmB [Eubacterium sp.]|nr:16S rRNA (cytosine(967)-C(5))-methyltransferase RsmB [Eubacterium sp.]
MNTREICFDILKRIEDEDAYVSDVLTPALRQLQFKEKRDRAFITRLVEGVTERKISLDYIIDKLSQSGKSGKKQKLRPDVRLILRMGIYQIRYMDTVPDRAAISESVDLAKAKGYSGLAGYINAILRKVQTICEENRFDSFLMSSLETRYSTPKWLCEFLVNTYGKDTAKKILEDQFADHDTVIRCNLQKTTLEELSGMLTSKGVTVNPAVICKDTSLRITGYDMITRLPGYKEGYFTVQDETSTYTVSRIGIKPGDYILDLCAAPGGKSMFAYELACGEEKPGLVISRDVSERKIEKIRENAERLGIPVSEGDIPAGIKLEIKDATLLDEDFANRSEDKKADVVIADVPCSGLGIIGRKNDIKYHASPESMKELASIGLTILKNATYYIKESGMICYSTCTINPGENREVVDAFLKSIEGQDFKLLEEKTFLQGVDGFDGFYYAILGR